MQTQYNLDLDMSFSLKINDEDLSSVTKMKIDMESDKVGAVKLEMSFGTMDLDSYIDFDGQNAVAYVYFMGVWVKSSQIISDYYDEDGSTDDYINALNEYTSYEALDDATLDDGTEVKVYEFTVNAPEILDDTLGEDYDINELGLTEDEFAEIFEKVVYTISIDEEAKLIRKIEIDLEPILNEILEIAKEKDSSVDDTFTYASMIIELSNFGEVDVTIPESVKESAISE